MIGKICKYIIISVLILLFISWEIVTIRFKYSIFTPFSFPILISLVLLLALRSFFDNVFYSLTWKGRSYKTDKKKLKIWKVVCVLIKC